LEEAVEGGVEEEGEEDFGDEVAGEEEDAGGGESCKPGVEGGAQVESLFGPAIAEECEQQNSDGLGEMSGKGVEAEDAKAEGDKPIRQRSFFKVANAVDAEGHEVAGEGHVTGSACVGGIGVVEQRRGEEGGEVDNEPEAGEDEEGEGAARGAAIDGWRGFDGDCEGSLVNHDFALLFLG
jgi:hypothetical protein